MPADTYAQREWDAFYSLVKGKAGIDFQLYKQDQLRRRILSTMDARGVANLQDFGKRLGADEKELRSFLDRMAINVSELFRNPEKWKEMTKIVIPELLGRSSKLKCWSAGCSYGAEAHTLAAVLHREFPGGHSILGTDIDVAALDQAKRGEFSTADMRGVPADYRGYFEERDGSWWAKAEIKRALTFRNGNLLSDPFDVGFDLIMCRNVVIYFNDEAKDALYRRFYEALKPGGILFVGSTERIFNARELGFESQVPFFYQKPTAGDKAWRNAS